MSVVVEAGRSGRVRETWRASHECAVGVPRWARTVAYAVPFTVLPSSVWRIAGCTFHAPIALGTAGSGNLPWWLPLEVYVVLMSILSELLAFTAVGLVAGWGEVFPRWIPGLRGRRVPVAAAVVPAAIGTAVLTLFCTLALVTVPFRRTIQGHPIHGADPLDYHHWQGVLALVAYAPLLLWGPLLGSLTIAYWRRRRMQGGAGEL